MRCAGPTPRQLGAAYRQLRRAAGLSQEQVATLAGVSYGYISRYESGHYARPSYHVLHGLAAAVGIEGADTLARALHMQAHPTCALERVSAGTFSDRTFGEPLEVGEAQPHAVSLGERGGGFG